MKSKRATIIREKVIHNLFNSSPLETPLPGAIAPERRASLELHQGLRSARLPKMRNNPLTWKKD